MIKTLLAVAIGAAFSMNAMADSSTVKGPMAFDPISASAYNEATSDATILNSEPWVIPQGYRQVIVSDESALDIYPGMSDWNDMNTVNETRKHAGRYMYRTHEVRPGADLNAFAGGTATTTPKALSRLPCTRLFVHHFTQAIPVYRIPINAYYVP